MLFYTLLITFITLLNQFNAAPLLQKRLITSGSIPSYAFDYAPYVYLSQTEKYFPSKLETHLENSMANLDYDPIPKAPTLTLDNVDFKNVPNFYVTSKDGAFEGSEDWLISNYGIPDHDGISRAPVHIIAVDKSQIIGEGYVDVFYFYFYSFNKGPVVLGVQFDLHIGDWEHSMIRFHNGIPTAVFYSQHSDGAAYSYTAVKKSELRPITYVATGSHANYPTTGRQDYGIAIQRGPFSILYDTTSQGNFWNVTQNYYGAWYSANEGFQISPETVSRGIKKNYLDFIGVWGDKASPSNDFESGQYCIGGQCRYEDGPQGPIALNKNLLRAGLCASSVCPAQTSLPSS